MTVKPEQPAGVDAAHRDNISRRRHSDYRLSGRLVQFTLSAKWPLRHRRPRR